jgi:hypothetical protein
VVAAVIVGGVFVVRKIVVKKAAETMTEKMIENIDTSELSDEEASRLKDVYKNMSEKDKAVIEEIVSDHIDMGTVQKATEYVTNGDTESLKKMADEELTEEEKAKMKEIYKKYLTENK